MKLKPLYAAMLLGAVLSPTVHAIDLDDNVRLEGFGTVGAFRADDPIAEVRADPRQGNGSRDGSVRTDADTTLAAQFTVNPNGPVKGVVQFVSKQDYRDSIWPKVEWAYLGWDVNSSFNVKFGRSVAPIFMTSDTRNVAFAQIMARPMNTVYQINPVTNVNGVTAKWRTYVNESEWGVEAMAGNSTVANSTSSIDVTRLLGIAGRYNNGPWTARVGYSTFAADIVSAKLTAAKAAVGALQTGSPSICSNCSTVVNERSPLEGVSGKIATAGVLFDDDTYIAQAEYVTRPGNSTFIPDVKGWYVMAGKRINNWTPYAMLGQFKVTEPDLGLQASTANPTVVANIKHLNDSFLSLGNGSRKQIGAGVRWDFAPKFALKFQWDQYKIDKPSVGSNVAVFLPDLTTTTPSTFDGKVNSLTLNLDFLF